MSTTDYGVVRELALKDVAVLAEKGKTYGDSWKVRGGVGAFMMLARKWDRIENISKARGWDILAAANKNDGDILDDIADLRRYLLLVEAELAKPKMQSLPPPWAAVGEKFLGKSDPLAGPADSVGCATGPGYTAQGY